MRPGKLAYFMTYDSRPRAERRREARAMYKSYKRPTGIRSKALGQTRAMRRAGLNKEGLQKQIKQGKHASKKTSLRKYFKGWLFDSSEMYLTHLDKQVRKGKSVAEIQKLRTAEYRAKRKRRAKLYGD